MGRTSVEVILAVSRETGVPFLVLPLTSWGIKGKMAASQVEGGSWTE